MTLVREAEPQSITVAKPLRVLHLISNLDTGGAQEVVRTVVEHLASEGCEPAVCSFKDGPLRKAIENAGIPVFVIPPRRYGVMAFPMFLVDILRIRQDLVRVMDEHQSDVIQTHLLRGLDFLVLSLRAFPRSSGKPALIFWTIHNSNFMLRSEQVKRHKWLLKPKRFAHRWLYRLSGRWVDGIIAVSTDVKNSFIQTVGRYGNRITVIDNGVDLRRFDIPKNKALLLQELGLEENDFLIITVGTLKKQKGHRYLIEAAREVLRRDRRLHLIFAGDGPLRQELQNLAVECGVEDHIHFLGDRRDVPELLASSDCFVLPSLWEGLPMALIEAMASRLPVIATAVSGSKRVVIDQVTGLLVEPGDVDQLREAVLTVLADPDRAQEMGQAARQRVESEFSAGKQAREHLHLYQREYAR